MSGGGLSLGGGVVAVPTLANDLKLVINSSAVRQSAGSQHSTEKTYA